MPPAYVKPYVKRGKTDAADAEAIAEAVTQPTMRFVAVKTEAQQAVLMLHKTRDLLVRQRTMLINALRGHLSEFGIVSAQSSAGVQAALRSLILEQERLATRYDKTADSYVGFVLVASIRLWTRHFINMA